MSNSWVSEHLEKENIRSNRKIFNINDYPVWVKKVSTNKLLKESVWWSEFANPFGKIILNKKDNK